MRLRWCRAERAIRPKGSSVVEMHRLKSLDLEAGADCGGLGQAAKLAGIGVAAAAVAAAAIVAVLRGLSPRR
jgi:hypothetical protein